MTAARPTRWFLRSPLLLCAVAAAALAGCSKSADAPTGGSAAVARAPSTSALTTTTTTAATAASAPAATARSQPPTHGATPVQDAGIAWVHASNSADIDAGFARARAESKPVFVYWGAAWCPPCNQLKATLFNRQDFIARSRSFVPIYVDGDSPGAQKLGARFKVSGYPTMLLFDTRGTELTRLPGEVDAARYQSVLTLAMSASARPAAEVLAQARAGGAGMTADDWRLLAFYSWETDEQRLVPKEGLPALLRQLAATCPPDLIETSQRLTLQALAAAGSAIGTGSSHGARPRPDPAALAMLLQLLAQEDAARAQMDLIANEAVDITRGLTAPGTPQRVQLQAALDTGLSRMEADPQLSRADRLAALASRVELARIDDRTAQPPNRAASGTAGTAGGRSVAGGDRSPAGGSRTARPVLPPALLADVRATAERADREITDGYERQAVVTSAADLLDRAGLGAESDALLRANLTKSHSPYYLMSALARHAKERGDRAEALTWYQTAFDKSEGPATRLQWGASYLAALIDLSPQDDTRIEATAGQLLGEASALPDAFDGRSGRSLQRVGSKLQGWNGPSGNHATVLRRLQVQLDGICAALTAGDSSHSSCDAIFKKPPNRVGQRA